MTKKNQINDYKKINKKIIEMKNEAVKSHHWNQILKKIKLFKKYKNLTIGDLYKHGIQKYDKICEEILDSA